jgi:sugar lactone lactonase YvrE
MFIEGQAWGLPSVPSGFSIKVVASGLPSGSENALQDVAPGQGGLFGNHLYYIVNQNQIWRVDPLGGMPELFATVFDPTMTASQLTVLSFGFDGDLFAVDGNANPGRVFRIKPDGTATLFSGGVPTASEGIAYSPNGIFGKKLYLSEFDNNPNPISSIDSNAKVDRFATLNGSNRLTGLAFSQGGSFGTDLFGVDHSGVLYRIAPDGMYSQFSIRPQMGQNETLAFGNAHTLFGDNLFVTPDGKGNILKITPSGGSSVFASGFAGFDYRGVTGLKFSQDNKTLFVTDDVAGTIYAISGQEASDSALWKFSIVAVGPAGTLSDPALDKAPVSGKWQVAFGNNYNAFGGVPPFFSLSDPTLSIDTPGVYLKTIGADLTTIAARGDPTPMRKGYVLDGADDSFSYRVSLSQGSVAFIMNSSGNTVKGIYKGDGLKLERVADTMMQIPEGGGAAFTNFGIAPSIDGGNVVFYGDNAGHNHLLPATIEGIYGDFGNSFLEVVADTHSKPRVGGVELGLNHVGIAPSISSTFSGTNIVAFDAAFKAASKDDFRGIVTRILDNTSEMEWAVIADTLNDFPYGKTVLSSPSIGHSGRFTFHADVRDDISNPMGGSIYAAGAYSPTEQVATAQLIPPEGGTFKDFGLYPSIDASQKQQGNISKLEHWLGFATSAIDPDPDDHRGEGVYLQHDIVSINTDENTVISRDFDLFKVIGWQGIKNLLEPVLNSYPIDYININLFHDAVMEGAVAFRVSLVTRGDQYKEFFDAIIFAELCALNLDANVKVKRGGLRLNRSTKNYAQQVTIKNEGASDISGPVSLALDNLSTNAALFNRADSCGQPALPYINVNLGSDNVLSPGETRSVMLEFTNPTNQSITYDTRMLSMISH